MSTLLIVPACTKALCLVRTSMLLQLTSQLWYMQMHLGMPLNLPVMNTHLSWQTLAVLTLLLMLPRFINLVEDQDSTDLQKCLTCARQHVACNAEQFPQDCRITLLVLGERMTSEFS